MKITQFRGDLRTFRNLELEAGVEAMKSEVSRKRVEDLRISLPYLNPYNRSSQVQKGKWKSGNSKLQRPDPVKCQ